MNSGGISVKGKFHKKNQDSFICEKIGSSYIAAVSDGLGSKIFSEKGSTALVNAARAIFFGRNGRIENLADFGEFIFEIYNRWLISLEVQNFSVKDCYCTALICVVLEKKIFVARLGDGFTGIRADSKNFCFFDDKKNKFVNETDCLTENFKIAEWQLEEISYKKFEGAVLCTDGVAFGENKAEKFLEDFCAKNFNKPRLAILNELKILLENWKSNDDKTLAFILAKTDVI